MAALLDRAWDEGMASWSASLVAEGSVAGVRSGLAVAPFDRLRANGRGGALIGADRASDLAVNVVLPFARAWGNLSRDGGLSTAALALYRAWPPLQENAVTQEAARLLGVEGADGKELRRSARRQQGLDPRVQRRRRSRGGLGAAPSRPSGQASTGSGRTAPWIPAFAGKTGGGRMRRNDAWGPFDRLRVNGIAASLRRVL